jgi:hypothetical protein
MTTKADLLFLTSDKYGPLYYHNVYSFYEEPITFSALNEFGQLYFCYSLGLDDNYEHDQWLIVPISEQKINKLEQKDIPIVKAIQQSSNSNVLFTKINLESNKIIEVFQSSRNPCYLLPDASIFINENINYDGTRKYTHRIRIAKENSKDIVSALLDKASIAFSAFCKNYLSKFDISNNFYPHDAVEGSFVYRVKADSKEELQSKGHSILSSISNKKEFLASLDAREIDLRIVVKLFNILLANKLQIQLIDEDSTNAVVTLTPNYVSELLHEVDLRLGSYLDSSMVPQADNLDRLKLYLQLTSENGFVTPESLKVDKRQVDYYRDACKILSLTHSYSTLTPLGIKALNAENERDYVKIIQRQFEETECGSIWMLKYEVDSLVNIKEETAADFLINNCNGLSESTSRRRAQTLKSWVKKFKKFI